MAMKNRMFRMMGILSCGCAFQLLGCNSQDLADILIAGVRTTAVDVTTFVVESSVDRAFGIDTP